MDPLSITTGVLSLVGTGIKAIQTFQSVAAKYSLADLTIVSIRTECTSIRLALSQIQGIIAREPNLRDATNPDESGDEMWEEYRVALDACSITFNILSDRLTKLKMDEVDEYNAVTAKSRIKALMKSDEMDCLVQNIRGQALALALLLQVFQAAAAGRSNLLRQERSSMILQNVTNNARSLIGSIRRSRTGSSGFSVHSSVIGEEEFDFDDEVVNSRAYRRIMARHRARRSGNASDDEVEQNDEPPTAQLADEVQPNQRYDIQINYEEVVETPENEVLSLESHPPENEDGHGDWINASPAMSPNPEEEQESRWQNPRAAPKPPTSYYFTDDAADYSMLPIFLDANPGRRAEHHAAAWNPGPDTNWPLRQDLEAREFPGEPSNPSNIDKRDQEGAASDKSLSPESGDAERERVLADLLSRVEDWKNHNSNNFGKLMLWGKYQILAHNNPKTFLAYLFENIFICCREAKVPEQDKSRVMFLRKKPIRKPEIEAVPDPDSRPLRLTGRVFIRNITESIQGTDENGLCTLHVFWKDVLSGDFIVTYPTEIEMLRWAMQVNILREKLNDHSPGAKRLKSKGTKALPMTIAREMTETPAELGEEDTAWSVLEEREGRIVPRYNGFI